MGGLSRLTASVHGGGNMTLREYILFWQETYDRHQSRPTTYAAHNYVFKNHILPGLGDVLLSELTSERVGEFLEERKHFGNNRPGSSGLGEETMRHIHRLLQQCLDQAIRDGLLTENPAKAFHYRKYMTVKANIMTSLEMEDYLDAAERLGYVAHYRQKLGEEGYRKACEEHALPDNFESMEYMKFLSQRRLLMAQTVRKAYMRLCE